jgi:hypothetical protein
MRDGGQKFGLICNLVDVNLEMCISGITSFLTTYDSNGFHRRDASLRRRRSLSTVGLSAGSGFQQSSVNFHSSSVYPRVRTKLSGFPGLFPLVISVTTEVEE